MRELTEQVLHLGQLVNDLVNQVAALEAKNRVLESSAGLVSATGGDGGGARKVEKSELRSVRKLYPEKWNPKDGHFRDWTDDFLRWLKAEDTELEEYMRAHQHDRAVVTKPDSTRGADLEFVHSHLKKLMGDAESRRIVKTVANCNGAEAWRLGAWVSVWDGESEIALIRAQEAERLDPLSPLQADLHAVRAAALFYAGRHDEAVVAARRSLANVPEATTPRRYLTAALAAAGHFAAARHELSELVKRQPNSSIRRTCAMHPLRKPELLERYLDALRQAGMPD